MLDRLPVELLAYTLTFLDSRSLDHLTNPASLYACCLVSKRVKEVAQPLLWRAVVVDKKGEFEAVKREVAAGELGRHIRIFEADGADIKATEVGALVQSLPGLAEVRLRNFEADLSNAVDELLPHLQDLRHISLSRSDFDNIKTPFPFNNLSSLSLDDVYTTESFLAGFLQPHNLPVLHSLRLESLSAGQGQGTFLPSFSNAFLRQLDILQLQLEAIHLAELEVVQYPATLFSGTIQDLREYVFEGIRPAPINDLHVRPAGLHDDLLHCDGGALQYVRQDARDVLGKLAAFIPSSGITTLLLPVQLQQSALTPERNQLLAACQMKGVEVLWADDAGKRNVFNEEFRRWVVEKKRAQGERAG